MSFTGSIKLWESVVINNGLNGNFWGKNKNNQNNFDSSSYLANLNAETIERKNNRKKQKQAFTPPNTPVHFRINLDLRNGCVSRDLHYSAMDLRCNRSWTACIKFKKNEKKLLPFFANLNAEKMQVPMISNRPYLYSAHGKIARRVE